MNSKQKNYLTSEIPKKNSLKVYDHVEIFYPSRNRWWANWYIVEIKEDGFLCADHWHSERPISGELFSQTTRLRLFSRDRVRFAEVKPLPLKPNGWYKSYEDYLEFCKSRKGGYDHTPMAGTIGSS